MSKPAAFLLVLLGTAACATEPTGPNPLSSEPRYDAGGWTIGSGRADPEMNSATESTVAGDSATKRGGYTYGSGN